MGEDCQNLLVHCEYAVVAQRRLATARERSHCESECRGKPNSFAIGSYDTGLYAEPLGVRQNSMCNLIFRKIEKSGRMAMIACHTGI